MLERLQFQNLPQVNIISPTQLNELKCKTLNDAIGNLGIIDCPICKNKGYVAKIKNDTITTQECECMAKRRSIRRIQKSGLSDMIKNYTFASYETPGDWQVKVKTKALEYIADSYSKWFVIVGTPGTGKTHICTAIAGELLNAGKDVRYMLWRNDAPRLKALVNERETYENELNALKRVDALYIDDFLKGNVTDADINLAFELLNDRYNSRRLITIISSEKTVEQILDIDEALGSRIYERSKDYCIKTPAENWRLK